MELGRAVFVTELAAACSNAQLAAATCRACVQPRSACSFLSLDERVDELDDELLLASGEHGSLLESSL